MTSFNPLSLSPLLIVCLVILAIQLTYLLVFLAGFSSDKRPVTTNGATGISIIVCAHDEEQNLRELIPLLEAQNYSDFEIIIVDDRSNDGTFDYLLKASSANPKVRMVSVRETPSHMTGKKFALTMGIKAAKKDWVLLTDADCRPSPNWVSGMSRYCVPEKNIIIGFSPYNQHPGLLNTFIRFEAFLTAIQYIGFALAGRPYMGVGRNLSYRKQLFLDSKGFNDHLHVLGGDDDLFVNKHAKSSSVAVATGTDVSVRSIPKTTWSDYFDQKVRHLSVGKRYRVGDRLLLGLFSTTWILSTVSFGALPFLGTFATILAAGLAVRWLVLILLFNAATRRLGEPFETWKVPFLDFIYAFYYLVAGPFALVTKRVQWKK